MKLGVFASIALLSTLSARGALAFCRTTTCAPESGSCSFDQKGCETTGKPLAWCQSMPLEFRFHRRVSSLIVKDEAKAAVRAAFYRWSDVVCRDGRRTSLRFREGDELDDDKPTNGRALAPFGVYFRDITWNHPSVGDTAFALTTVESLVRTGSIRWVDIEINMASHLLTTGENDTGTDLQTVVTHEVGHFLGIGHSVEPESIMAAALCATGKRCSAGRAVSRRLADDDRDAVCAIFPPDGGLPSSCETEAEGGCAAGGGAPANGAALAALVAAAAVTVARRAWRSGRTA